MNRSTLLPEPPVITQRSQAVAVRPATTQQAMDMLDLILADVLAQAESTMAGWAERMPLDDQDAARAKARAMAAKDRLSRMTQAYAHNHGCLDVPLISLGSDYGAMHAAIGPVLDKIAEARNMQHHTSAQGES